MKKIMHVAEPFATGVLSFLVDLTRQQVEEYEVYILYGVRPLTPDNVSNLFDKRVHLIKIDSFKGAIGTVFNFKAYRDVRRWYKKIDLLILYIFIHRRQALLADGLCLVKNFQLFIRLTVILF